MVFDEMPLWCLTGVDSMENERVLVWVFKIGFENLEDTWISQLLWKRGEIQNQNLEDKKEKRNFGFCRIKGLDREQGRNKRESEDQFSSLPTDRQRPLSMEKGQRVVKNEIGASSMEERKKNGEGKRCL